MNTPEHMAKTISDLHAAWQQTPELRLGQLIINACLPRGETCPSIYYLPDRQLTESVRALVDPLDDG